MLGERVLILTYTPFLSCFLFIFDCFVLTFCFLRLYSKNINNSILADISHESGTQRDFCIYPNIFFISREYDKECNE